ncbi:MAG: malate dehydrogenase [Chlamydiales bacterium]|nr:malate dehydrogenase [Chlamydiales bacterium]MCH9620575.1 malate dehydrogenase [Chlamydiales bacterium]MCH9623553.1 malate dehydrogenase [Chlamydiales bacterium]
MKKPLKVVITGASGQLAYHAIFRMADGEAFGKDQPLILHLCDLPGTESAMEGIAMELDDCCFTLLKEVKYGSDLHQMFDDVDFALLIGSKPRGPGMERGDLLIQNGEIFVGQGKALNERAKREAHVLVVGNPCNTNALVAMTHAPDLKREHFHAMLRLDQNRSTSMLAKRADVLPNELVNMIVWGNHSATQVPDYTHAEIKGNQVTTVIEDEKWLRGEFFELIQKRGAAIIQKLGRSSAASAGRAAIDATRALWDPTPEGEWFTSAVCTDHNPYGIEKNLIFGFPCRSQGEGKYEIISDLEWNSFIKEKILITQKELLEERACCAKQGLL